jgi:hypothetical protein
MEAIRVQEKAQGCGGSIIGSGALKFTGHLFWTALRAPACPWRRRSMLMTLAGFGLMVLNEMGFQPLCDKR